MQIEIRAFVEVPDGTPLEDVQEWVEYHMGSGCSLATENPLANTSLSCASVDVTTC